MTYKLFVCHPWSHHDDYKTLVYSFEKTGLGFCDFSVSRDRPIEGTTTDAELREAIKDRIRLVNCVFVLAGECASRSKWMQNELEIACELKKKIIAIRPHGNLRLSQPVQDNAFEIVNWSVESLRKAIKRAAN